MAFYQFKKYQQINASKDELWDFISSPMNLQEITPDDMGFDIISDIPIKMYPGLMIHYKVRPLLGIPTTWITEISQVREKEYFVDEQRMGPYKLWHHQHIIEPIKNGMLMTDIVSYSPPYGIIGVIANQLIIKKKLLQIFDYRTRAIEKRFGKYQV